MAPSKFKLTCPEYSHKISARSDGEFWLGNVLKLDVHKKKNNNKKKVSGS